MRTENENQRRNRERTFVVEPRQVGYLYRGDYLKRVLHPGTYTFDHWNNNMCMVILTEE
jgi:hypothetical protein